MDNNTIEKLKRLKAGLKDLKSLVVSYSGGIDSTVLAVLAHEALSDSMVCVLIKSPLMPKYEYEYAVSLADKLSLPLKIIESDILSDPEFRENKKDRCYICKKKSAAILKAEAKRRGFLNIADGTNCSDISVFRPGYRAGCEEGIKHPFADAMITKDEIRSIASELSLPNRDKPSSSCLATRIPYGKELSEESLSGIERAEDIIRMYGISQIRVREFCSSARIEVMPADMPEIIKNREEISEKLKSLGFLYITLDLDGFVSGSMDRKQL